MEPKVESIKRHPDQGKVITPLDQWIMTQPLDSLLSFLHSPRGAILYQRKQPLTAQEFALLL